MGVNKELLYRVEYRVQLHRDALRTAIKRAQAATKAAEGGKYVRIG